MTSPCPCRSCRQKYTEPVTSWSARDDVVSQGKGETGSREGDEVWHILERSRAQKIEASRLDVGTAASESAP